MITNGVIYSQDLESNVQAIDLESGDVLWTTKFESPSHGPNGLAVAEGRVFGATATEAFALDQKTGKEVWSVATAEGGDRHGARRPRRQGLRLDRAGQHQRRIRSAAAVGMLWAMDAKTGKKLWHFDTVPKDLWGDTEGQLRRRPLVPALVRQQGRRCTSAPATRRRSPARRSQPWGSSRPGRNLYTDSLVKLDPKTGKLEWYYQETPHNIYDWDFQNSPIITKAGGKEVAIGSGKSGYRRRGRREDRQAGLADPGRQAQRPRQGRPATRCAANTTRSRPAKSSPARSAA